MLPHLVGLFSSSNFSPGCDFARELIAFDGAVAPCRTTVREYSAQTIGIASLVYWPVGN
jgi:hypothetical protein